MAAATGGCCRRPGADGTRRCKSIRGLAGGCGGTGPPSPPSCSARGGQPGGLAGRRDQWVRRRAPRPSRVRA